MDIGHLRMPVCTEDPLFSLYNWYWYRPIYSRSMIFANFAKMPSSYTMDSDRCSILRPTFARFSGRPPESKRRPNPCRSFSIFRFFRTFNDAPGGARSQKTNKSGHQTDTKFDNSASTFFRRFALLFRCFSRASRERQSES